MSDYERGTNETDLETQDLNVDPEEIGHFDRLAEEWWDPEGPFKTLHRLNPFRLDYIEARRPLRGLRVLDVGCGGGVLSEGLAARGADVTGIDASTTLIEAAREHASGRRLAIDYRVGTVEALADAEPQSFDLVTCMELLEHVPDPASVVDACGRLLKEEGDLFVASINRTAKAYVFAIVGAEYLLRLLPRGTHHYSRFIRPSEVARWLRDCGLVVTSIDGFTLNPITNRFSLAASADVNYFVHAGRQAHGG